MEELQNGPVFKFSEWPSAQVPRQAAAVYTIWRAEELIYVGMSGRGIKAEGLDSLPEQGLQPRGLLTRLNAHASGRRSGDQFNVYVCDRFIVPALTLEQQADIGRGSLSLDQMTKSYVREHLSYRFLVCQDGKTALGIESAVRAGALPAGLPFLNPL